MGAKQIAMTLGLLLARYPSTRSWAADEIALTVEQYALGLSDVAPEVVMAAFEHVGGEWWPALHRVREAVAQITAGQVGSTAVDAWQQVTDAIRRYGTFCRYNDQVDAGMNARDGMPGAIEDPVAQAVVSAIGWNVLCTSDNPTADRARFLDLYEQKRSGAIEHAKLTPAARQVVQQLRIAAGAGSLKQLMNGEAKQ